MDVSRSLISIVKDDFLPLRNVTKYQDLWLKGQRDGEDGVRNNTLTFHTQLTTLTPGNGFSNFAADPWDWASGLLNANWVDKLLPHTLRLSGNKEFLAGSGTVYWNYVQAASVHLGCCLFSPSWQGGIATHKQTFLFKQNAHCCGCWINTLEWVVCPPNCWCHSHEAQRTWMCALWSIHCAFFRYVDSAFL